MKTFLLLMSMAFVSPIADDLASIRKIYKGAISTESKANDLVSKTEKTKYVDGVMRAYYGTGVALQAKYNINPITKMSKAKTAAYELNVAVNMKSNDLEVRFLRFSFESNLPSIVSVTKHLADDKKVILSKLDKTHGIWDIIKPFLLASSQLTEAEKKKVRDL